ncbi:unnamed protein product [Pieris brassicae]|uniref:Uncharacterized protein n=1 Tax=Pieris brassicae TaxID=7116 RepID=A0A9P0XFZ6_PIEBR|nr:unnamed protein product [Pieris brassicae]
MFYYSSVESGETCVRASRAGRAPPLAPPIICSAAGRSLRRRPLIVTRAVAVVAPQLARPHSRAQSAVLDTTPRGNSSPR